MTKDEFYELCLAASLDVRKKFIDELWCMILRMPPSEKVLSESKLCSLHQFVAACHIHDIEDKDSWLQRMAVALRLSYYDMSVGELARRAKGRSNQEASPQVSFATDVKPDHEDELNEDIRQEAQFEAVANIPILKDMAGLRAGADAVKELGSINSARKADLTYQLAQKVSINDHEQKLLQRMDQDEGDRDSVMSLESDQLSWDEISEMSEFDAQAFIVQEAGEEVPAKGGGVATGISRLLVAGDSALSQLMQVPVSEFFKGAAAESRKMEATSPWMRPILSKTTRAHQNELSMDPKPVRQALRDAYRNMPYWDFVVFVNFLLRGLHRIQAEDDARESYWHKDEPVFQSALAVKAKNMYCTDLLEKMGFVRVAGVYWLWPSVHLKEERHRVFWGLAEVPHQCPGQDEQRLQDMISLVTACLVALNNQGKSFTGHFDSRLAG